MDTNTDGWFRRELDDVENRRAEQALTELLSNRPSDDQPDGRP